MATDLDLPSPHKQLVPPLRKQARAALGNWQVRQFWAGAGCAVVPSYTPSHCGS